MDPTCGTGAKIRQTRMAAGVTLRQLAARVGMSHTYLGKVERGLRGLTMETADAIARALEQDMTVTFRPRPVPREPVRTEWRPNPWT
jgi:transcriptional regulator with XRE-family HTH domain